MLSTTAAVGASTPLTMPSISSSTTKRLTNTTACLPIVYGSIAYYLGKKADELQTHEWTLYVRGPNNEDISPAISKIVFELHPSFAQPIRELIEPPYEVTERGWGEFEAQIRIHWKTSNQQQQIPPPTATTSAKKGSATTTAAFAAVDITSDPNQLTPTILNHTIKLYPPGTPPNVLPTDTETPVIAETYDEVVFTDPTEYFFRSLTQIPLLPKLYKDDDDDNDDDDDEMDEEGKDDDKEKKFERQSDNKGSIKEKHKHVIVYSDQDEFLKLISAQEFLKTELIKMKQRYTQVQNDLLVVDQKLISAQYQRQHEAAVAAATGSTATPAGADSNVGGGTTSTTAKASSSTTIATSSNRKTKGLSSSQQRKRPGSAMKKAKTNTTNATTNPSATTHPSTTIATAATSAAGSSATTKAGGGFTSTTTTGPSAFNASAIAPSSSIGKQAQKTIPPKKIG